MGYNTWTTVVGDVGNGAVYMQVYGKYLYRPSILLRAYKCSKEVKS